MSNTGQILSGHHRHPGTPSKAGRVEWEDVELWQQGEGTKDCHVVFFLQGGSLSLGAGEGGAGMRWLQWKAKFKAERKFS